MPRKQSSKRVFGEISRLPSGRYRARLRLPGGERVSAPVTFVAKMDAELWLAHQERDISRGEWTPPTRATIADRPTPDAGTLLGDYAEQVLSRRQLRPTTVALYDKLLRVAIHPAFANRALDSITPDDVARWYRSMDRTPTQQANAYGLLKSRSHRPCAPRQGTRQRSVPPCSRPHPPGPTPSIRTPLARSRSTR